MTTPNQPTGQTLPSSKDYISVGIFALSPTSTSSCELPFETHDKAQMLFCFSKLDIGQSTPKYFEIPLSFLSFHLSVYLE